MDSFHSHSKLKVGSKEYEIYRLDALDREGISTQRLPYWVNAWRECRAVARRVIRLGPAVSLVPR